VTVELTCWQDNLQMIAPPVPVADLIVDPRAGQLCDHGPFTALAQGSDWRRKLERLDALLATVPQTEMPVTHRFSRGVYARELFIPKGTVLTGRIHKHSQINILLSGDISVLTEDGVKRLLAPVVFESPPGAKRAGYAHEDTVWLTICGTDTTDPDVLEDELTTRSYAEYDAWCAGLIEGE
jgi:quercetin dioxygenase-like cupin family protein